MESFTIIYAETMKRKTIIRSIVLLVLVGISVWVWSRWNAWFGNPVEAPYVSSPIPSRILLTFGDSIGENRNVSWQCDSVLMPSHLELQDLEGTSIQTIPAKGETYESEGGKAAYYVARLRGLKSGHQYRYRVCTNEHYSDWYQFSVSTHPNHTEFLYVGDVQDSIGGIANQLLRQALRQHPHVEFLVFGGDLIQRPLDCYWAELFRNLDSIAPVLPILTITGNHEYKKGIICQLDPRFWLVHSFYQDSRVDDNQVFTVRYGNLQLFCLDSNREFWRLWQQRSWLERQLATCKAKWKIVVLHHPLHSIKSKTNNLIQRWMFDDLVRDYEVDIVLQGHEHAYTRLHVDTPTPIYTVSHCSPKNYNVKNDERFDCFGTGSRYYQKIQTHLDTLFLTAYDAVSGELYDSIPIMKQ